LLSVLPGVTTQAGLQVLLKLAGMGKGA